ncbi:MAG: hypothetical protein CL564_04670 [Alphaproteobacteria bacterium]|nr:hypothetical protein [Pelagibacterales bacterium]MAW58896.1 hypothetical protein [Alphaproteobacteria bacterium]OUV28078.1 MAG: hypothetical protein CBC69_01290 [Alphaproteobacteria bacterium TMED109]RCL83177.1 MAG: DUF502 domain-containing protein [Alphaproteobacteria bacterium]|tara:strand:- start:579 stop:1229 length:651 start_codon:yes stop_codon:yes gene_type:complete
MKDTKSIFTKIRGYFLTGIIVTAPIGLTFYVSFLFIGFIDSKVRNIIPVKYHYDNILPFEIPGIGLLIVFIMLTFIGFLTAGIIGRYIIKLGERIIARLPIIRSVYGALKQIFESVLKTSSKSFREVVLIEYPRKGIWAIGFITGDTKGEVQESSKDELVNVFLPTTPNPTSGFLLFVPRKDLRVLNMNVEEGIKMVISGGIVTPKFKKKYMKNKN